MFQYVKHNVYLCEKKTGFNKTTRQDNRCFKMAAMKNATILISACRSAGLAHA